MNISTFLEGNNGTINQYFYFNLVYIINLNLNQFLKMQQNFTLKTLPSILFLSILLSSCTQRIYFPDKVVTPGLTAQFETKVNLSFRMHNSYSPTNDSTSSLKFSPSIDLAFSPLNHLGVFGSYKTLLNKYFRETDIFDPKNLDNTKTFGGTFNDRILEFGIGYFNKLGKKAKFEIYAGYGTGNLKRTGPLFSQFDFTSKYHRFFIQPAAGIDFKHVSLMGGVKITNQKHDNFNSPIVPDLRLQLGLNGSDILKENFWLVQPFVTVEVGWEYLKFNAQIGIGTSSNETQIYSNRPIGYFSIGLVGQLNPGFWKKK